MRRDSMKYAPCAPITLLLFGCAISQKVQPLEPLPTKTVCIVENPAVRAGFLAEYRRSLESLGYAVRILPPEAEPGACVVTSTYVARWSWDVTIYLSYAVIVVYLNGSHAGHATYDSRYGSANMRKFIDAEPKILELVGELFPPAADPPAA
jgi:hypothetical protein